MPDTHGHAHGHAHGNGHGNAHGHAHGNAHGHDHGGHDHGEPLPVGTRPLLRAALRFVVATVIVLAAVMTACSVMVPAGEAIVISQLGDPVRVLTSPGLAWKFPAPIQTAIPIDLRLRTTSTGLQDVGTRDGLRILVQVYVAWQVLAEPAPVRKFLRAARNDQDEAARQLRSYVGSALQVAASRFDLSDLVNTDPAKVQLPAFEERVRSQIGPDVLATYGIAIREVGIERLSLPDITLAATVERMRAERETVAAQRTAEGLRAAAEIRSDAARDSRITVARAKTEAAAIEAEARRAAAEIYGKAYTSDPSLYLMLRSLDTLGQVVSANTRLVLRTDAPPFDLLTQPLPGGPPSDGH